MPIQVYEITLTNGVKVDHSEPCEHSEYDLLERYAKAGQNDLVELNLPMFRSMYVPKRNIFSILTTDVICDD